MVLTVLSTKLSLAMELSSGDVHRMVQCTVREGVHVGYWAQDKLVHGCCRHSRNICCRCPLPLRHTTVLCFVASVCLACGPRPW